MKIQDFIMGFRTTSNRNIFISYRRKDTETETYRLVDALKERFDENRIFIDVEKIEPGLDFSQVISQSLDSCDVMLVIIGPNWLEIDPVTKTPRIRNPHDWVRQEISTAIKRNIRIIPVLMDGGSMPLPEQLPDDLLPLLMRQKCDVSNRTWKYDTNQLIEFLEKKVGIPAKNNKMPLPLPLKEKTWLRKNLVWVMVISVLGIFIWFLLEAITLISDPNVKPILQSFNQPLNVDSTPSYNPGGVEPVPHEKSQQFTNNPSSSSPSDKPAENITTLKEQPTLVHGTWIDGDGSRFIFNQNDDAFTLNGYSIDGEFLGTGNGRVDNEEVNFDFNFLNAFSITCKLRISVDGRQMSGELTSGLINGSSLLILTKLD